MPDELRALTEELHAVNVMLGRVVDRLDAADRKHRRHRFGTFVLAVLVVWTGVNTWQDRERSCEQSNQTRADIRAGIVETVLTIAADAEDPERITQVVERIQDRLEVTIPDRDC